MRVRRLHVQVDAFAEAARERRVPELLAADVGLLRRALDVQLLLPVAVALRVRVVGRERVVGVRAGGREERARGRERKHSFHGVTFDETSGRRAPRAGRDAGAKRFASEPPLVAAHVERLHD
ncbi:hypothetical protein, partial [Pseudomonas sp. 21_B]|uniref:hypothetical protein n=1 Tax=Pseudomonas sp. 21_B TaxID=2813561 RepID=UPI001A9D4858